MQQEMDEHISHNTKVSASNEMMDVILKRETDRVQELKTEFSLFCCVFLICFLKNGARKDNKIRKTELLIKTSLFL